MRQWILFLAELSVGTGENMHFNISSRLATRVRIARKRIVTVSNEPPAPVRFSLSINVFKSFYLHEECRTAKVRILCISLCYRRSAVAAAAAHFLFTRFSC